MKIECTADELKKLIKKDTSVAGTTDVVQPMNNIDFIKNISKEIAKNLTNCDIHEEQSKSSLS